MTDNAPHTSPDTGAVHGPGTRPQPHAGHALTTPLLQTATYTFDSSADLRAFMDAKMWGGAGGRHEYARYGNPTVRSAEIRIAALEGSGADALLFASGMAAITNTLLTIVPAGGHIILTDDCYSKTRAFCQTFLRRFNIDTTLVPLGDYAALAAAIRPETRVFLTELPTNPTLRVLDLARLAAIGREYPRLKTIVDATFATPINIRPLAHGVDLVIHSASKYLSGHNDILAGAVVGAPGLIQALRQAHGMLGAVLDPHTAFLLERGLKTVAVRVTRQNATALRLARCLEDHPAVARVWYPGLPSHPDHAVAARQMTGFGGVVSFELAPRADEPPLETAARFVDAVRIPLIAASLGGVESLIEQPAIMSYYDMSTEERAAIGIPDGLVRLAVGIEDADELASDLMQALAKLAA